MKTATFFKENKKQLDLFTKAITKAHGTKHPEVFDVRRVYQKMQQKMQRDDWQLDDEWDELRKITKNYAIPADVCQTFAKTYQMLAEFDKLYQNRS